MRFCLQSPARATSVGHTVLSVVTHVVLVTAVVYDSGIRASKLEERIAESVYFVPPPDRRPSAPSQEERLAYVDVGAGLAAGTAIPDGELPSPTGTEESTRPGGLTGVDSRFQVPSVLLDVPQDSVYSVLEVDETAVRTEGSAAPVYPGDLIRARIEGSVLIRFVVDTNGRADPASVEVMRESHSGFTQAVRNAIPLMFFSPAMVRGHRVRQAVEQNFEFRIAAPPPTPADRTRPTPAP